LWTGCKEGTARIDFLVEERWVDKVLEVQRVSERIMVLRVRVGETVLNVVAMYAPQVGRAIEEFVISLGEVLSAIDVKEQLIICGDMNGHVGAVKMVLKGYI